MKKFSKVIFSFLFVSIAILVHQTVFAEQDEPEIPEYCSFLIDGETVSNTTVNLDGTLQVEPKSKEDFEEYYVMLPRADNGRGNGTLHYSNPLLPIGDEHQYALVQYWNIDGENQPYEGSNTYPGVIGEDGELVFSITELGYGCNLFLCKVMTIEEVEICNQFLEDEIDTEKLFIEDGFVYLSLKDYGVLESFRLGILAATESSHVNESNDNMDNGNDNSEQDHEFSDENSNEDSNQQGVPPEQPTEEPSG